MNVSIFDLLLAITLIFLVWQMLCARDLLVSIVLFIIFGMLVSLAWIQLKAPDIALVEAVIGSALTGALFLGCLGHIESFSEEILIDRRYKSIGSKIYDYLFSLSVIGFGVILSWGVLTLSENTPGLTDQVQLSLSKSGVENPVTAVILNFRGYDTLLEIGVLFLVVVAIYALQATEPVSIKIRPRQASRILVAFLHILTPLMTLVAFYLLWVGGFAPGGAFQAGAMLAGVGILMLLGGVQIPLTVKSRLLRFICTIGFGGFLLIGLGVMDADRNFLEYPQEFSKKLIFLIEFLATISISFILVTLFAGCSGFLSYKKSNPRAMKGVNL